MTGTPPEKPDKSADREKQPRIEEARQILEQYVEDLRAIVDKLRRHLS